MTGTDLHGPYVQDLETTKKEFERYIGDLSGMVYTTKDNWEFEMLKELNAAGMKIDMNKLLG